MKAIRTQTLKRSILTFRSATVLHIRTSLHRPTHFTRPPRSHSLFTSPHQSKGSTASGTLRKLSPLLLYLWSPSGRLALMACQHLQLRRQIMLLTDPNRPFHLTPLSHPMRIKLGTRRLHNPRPWVRKAMVAQEAQRRAHAQNILANVCSPIQAPRQVVTHRTRISAQAADRKNDRGLHTGSHAYLKTSYRKCSARGPRSSPRHKTLTRQAQRRILIVTSRLQHMEATIWAAYPKCQNLHPQVRVAQPVHQLQSNESHPSHTIHHHLHRPRHIPTSSSNSSLLHLKNHLNHPNQPPVQFHQEKLFHHPRLPAMAQPTSSSNPTSPMKSAISPSSHSIRSLM